MNTNRKVLVNVLITEYQLNEAFECTDQTVLINDNQQNGACECTDQTLPINEYQ